MTYIQLIQQLSKQSGVAESIGIITVQSSKIQPLFNIRKEKQYVSTVL